MVQLDEAYTLTKNNEIKTKKFKITTSSSIGATLLKHMRIHNDKVAQIQCETNEQDTFGDLLKRSIRTALHLKAQGINPGDIISLCTNNHLDSCVPFLAGQFIGAVTAALDSSLSPEELHHLVTLTQPKIIFTISQSAQILEKIIKNNNIKCEIVIFGENTFLKYLSPIQGEDNFAAYEVPDLSTTAIIHYSSGSTGLPKGICLNHYAVMYQALAMGQIEDPDIEYMQLVRNKISGPYKFLTLTGLYWISSTLGLITSVINGFCRLLVINFDPNELWMFIAKYKPMLVALTPFYALEMVAVGRPEHLDFDGWFVLILLGSTISYDNIKKIKNILPEVEVFQSYGQTEAAGNLSSFQTNSIQQRHFNRTKLGSIGVPLRGYSFRVVDPDTGKNFGPGQVGELQIKSKLIMNGYYNMDSEKAFTKDGWLKTGDLIYFDEDFCFFIVDRIKEVFKYRGWFIAPKLLESKLLEHPAVKQAVVIGIPHDDGERPMGVVVLKEEQKGVSEKEIEMFVEERVSERQRLRAGVKIIEQMPLSVTGKIKKFEISKMFRPKLF